MVVWQSRFLKARIMRRANILPTRSSITHRARSSTPENLRRLQASSEGGPCDPAAQLQGETQTLCGIDSGDNSMWSKDVQTLERLAWLGSLSRTNIRLEKVTHVGAVKGVGEPYERLTTLLNSGFITFAAIDGPFSGEHRQLTPSDRHFPKDDASVWSGSLLHISVTEDRRYSEEPSGTGRLATRRSIHDVVWARRWRNHSPPPAWQCCPDTKDRFGHSRGRLRLVGARSLCECSRWQNATPLPRTRHPLEQVPSVKPK
ncbi:MAG: hypothetical protein JWM36_2722 [Hyphomicrobiales bacterium]|nr:hypothetical protein [Hyphomicrobiales bacterium]